MSALRLNTSLTMQHRKPVTVSPAWRRSTTRTIHYLEVIGSDPLPTLPFELIHAPLVLFHVPARANAPATGDKEVVQVLTLLDDLDFAYSEPVLFTALPTSQLYAEADKPSHR